MYIYFFASMTVGMINLLDELWCYNINVSVLVVDLEGVFFVAGVYSSG